MASKNLEAVRAEHTSFNARDWASIQRLIADGCVFVDGKHGRVGATVVTRPFFDPGKAIARA